MVKDLDPTSFGKEIMDGSIKDNAPSPLLQCGKCKVQIHAKCYGVEDHEIEELENDHSKEWQCDRCKTSSRRALCVLCNKQGGALKQVSNQPNKWAHIVCALGVPKVYFDDVDKRKGINISALPKKAYNPRCVYCKDSEVQIHGVPIKCAIATCNSRSYFHVSCAFDHDHYMEEGNYPDPIYVYCKNCGKFAQNSAEYENNIPNNSELRIGETVRVKKRGSWCKVKLVKMQLKSHHKVHFNDNTYSGDVFQEHIRNHDWSKYPAQGSIVEIDWTDGKTYEAYYKGFSIATVYQCQHEDGKLVKYSRSELYSHRDTLPKKPKRRKISSEASGKRQCGSIQSSPSPPVELQNSSSKRQRRQRTFSSSSCSSTSTFEGF